MTEEQGNTFEIDGETFELPVFGSFTLDEAVILYDIAGVLQEQLAPLNPDTASDEEKKAHDLASLRRIGDPRFKLALAAIAYRRKYPDADEVKMRLAAGSANALDVTMAFLWGDGDPPAKSSPKPLENKRSISDPSRSPRTGTDSGSDSEGQVVALSATGTGR